MSTGASVFLAPGLPGVDQVLTLDAAESRHAAGARRLSTGDRLRLVDGRGGVAEGRIESVGPGGVTVRITSRATEPPPLPAVHLAAALPRGDRQSMMLDMSAQLGLRRFTPLACRRAVVRAERVNAARLQRVLVEACKQSGQSHVPELEVPATPEEVARAAAADGDVAVLLAPGAPRLADVLARCAPGSKRGVTLLVGPEGGFEQSELAAMRAAGALEASLTDTVLRVETAAVCAVALVRAAPR